MPSSPPSCRALRAPLSVLVAALLLPACTSIQLDPSYDPSERLPGEGESVVTLAGSYSYSDDEGDEREGLDLRAEAGVHAADEHELGVWLLGRYTNRERDPDGSREGWGGVFYRYHWYPSDRTSLFLGPTLGVSLFDDGTRERDAFGYGVQVGARRWVSTAAALTLTPTVFWTDDSATGSGSSRDVVVYWGVSLRL